MPRADLIQIAIQGGEAAVLQRFGTRVRGSTDQPVHGVVCGDEETAVEQRREQDLGCRPDSTHPALAPDLPPAREL